MKYKTNGNKESIYDPFNEQNDIEEIEKEFDTDKGKFIEDSIQKFELIEDNDLEFEIKLKDFISSKVIIDPPKVVLGNGYFEDFKEDMSNLNNNFNKMENNLSIYINEKAKINILNLENLLEQIKKIKNSCNPTINGRESRPVMYEISPINELIQQLEVELNEFKTYIEHFELENIEPIFSFQKISNKYYTLLFLEQDFKKINFRFDNIKEGENLGLPIITYNEDKTKLKCCYEKLDISIGPLCQSLVNEEIKIRFLSFIKEDMYTEIRFNGDMMNKDEKIIDIERLKKYVSIDKKIVPGDNIILKIKIPPHSGKSNEQTEDFIFHFFICFKSNDKILELKTNITVKTVPISILFSCEDYGLQYFNDKLYLSTRQLFYGEEILFNINNYYIKEKAKFNYYIESLQENNAEKPIIFIKDGIIKVSIERQNEQNQNKNNNKRLNCEIKFVFTDNLIIYLVIDAYIVPISYSFLFYDYKTKKYLNDANITLSSYDKEFPINIKIIINDLLERKKIDGKLLINDESDILDCYKNNNKDIRINKNIFFFSFKIFINNKYKCKFRDRNYNIRIMLKIFNQERNIQLVFNYEDSIALQKDKKNDKFYHTTEYPIYIFLSKDKPVFYKNLNNNNNKFCLFDYSWTNVFEYKYKECKIDYKSHKIYSNKLGNFLIIYYLDNNGKLEFKTRFEESFLFIKYHSDFLDTVKNFGFIYFYPAFIVYKNTNIFPLVEIKNEDISFFNLLSIEGNIPKTDFGKLVKIMLNSKSENFIESLGKIANYFGEKQKDQIYQYLENVKKEKKEDKKKTYKLLILKELFLLFKRKFEIIIQKENTLFLDNITKDEILQKQKELKDKYYSIEKKEETNSILKRINNSKILDTITSSFDHNKDQERYLIEEIKIPKPITDFSQILFIIKLV